MFVGARDLLGRRLRRRRQHQRGGGEQGGERRAGACGSSSGRQRGSEDSPGPRRWPERPGRQAARDVARPRDRRRRFSGLRPAGAGAMVGAGPATGRGRWRWTSARASGSRARAAGAPRPKGRQLDDAALAEVRRLLGDRPRRRDLLIEFLHLIQDAHGHLSAAHLRALADEMRLAQAEVWEVATFYAHFDPVQGGRGAAAGADRPGLRLALLRARRRRRR